MIKFKLFKGEKDQSEIVFIQKDEEASKKLIFDVIKDYAFLILKETVGGNDNKYIIEINDASLESYKQIVETVFKSIIDDKELQELYKETMSPVVATEQEDD